MNYLIILKSGKEVFVDLPDETFDATAANAIGYSTNETESFVKADGLLIRLSEISLIAKQERAR